MTMTHYMAQCCRVGWPENCSFVSFPGVGNAPQIMGEKGEKTEVEVEFLCCGLYISPTKSMC